MASSESLKLLIRDMGKAALQARRRSREWIAELEASPVDPTKPKSVFLCLRRRARAGGKPWKPEYAWSLTNAAVTAKRLGIERISGVEFGVAGGNGLVALEGIADELESLIGVGIEIFGFDTGGGLPAPSDRRDVPFLLSEGDYPMDQDQLRARLHRAELLLGLVSTTLPDFIAREAPPVGFVSFDMDYYSSTMESFALLEADPGRLLPRVFCHFDDVALYPWTDFNGERAAIADFNASHEDRKISHVHGLRYWLPSPDGRALWPEKAYVVELFDHPLYMAPEGVPGRASLAISG